MNNISIIESLPIFRSLSRHDLENIAAITTSDSFGPGEYVCRQGETGDMLFVIVTGSVLIREGSQVIARLGPGQVVGELAVLDKHPRAADVVAAERLHVLALDGAQFRGLIQDGGALAVNLLEELAGRIRSTSARQERVDQLVRAFRERGHVLASLDPLGRDGTAEHPELTLAHYGLADGDFAERFTVMLGREVCERSLRSIMDRLRKAYCGAVGAQYMHIDDLTVQHWLRERLEDPAYQHEFGIDPQQRILMKLTDAEIFETFVHRKFRGSKRFSLQGGETLIPLLDQAIESAGAMGIDEIVIGMAHRGRLNVLANILGKPPREIFKEFEDTEIDRHYGMGDVKYHKGFASDYITTRGHSVHLSLCFNPSHLECVGPVVLGRARADQDRWGDSDGSRVLPLVIHGDAAFAGQGVVQELLNLSALPGYSTGGALHIILNNQLGFTTLPIEGRSSQYATDVARMLQIPIFHVNGERPEAVDQVIQLAMDFRKSLPSRRHRRHVLLPTSWPQ